MDVIPTKAGSNCLELNLAAIMKRWPDLGRQLSVCAPVQVELVGEPGSGTLRVEGIHLASTRDRQAEARLQASLVPPNSSFAYVYGPGLGDLPRALLQRKNLQELRVVIMNPRVTCSTFEFFDQRDWLNDPRVRLLTATEFSEIRFPFAAVPPCLQLAADEAAELRDLVVLELASPYIRKKQGAENELLKERLAANRDLFAADPDAGELFGFFPGGEFVVAAAGPTLAESYPWLHRPQPQRILIAVDAALRPLLQAGIRPDFVVCIDYHYGVFDRFFAGLDPEMLRQTTLVYFPVVSPEALKSWPGPRRAALAALPIYSCLRRTCSKGELFCSGSVIHPATDLAVKLGASRVFLAGADFCFPEGLSHVAGSRAVPFDVTSKRDWVFSGEGEKVATTPSLRGYLRDLECYLARHPEVSFYTCSRRGARIRGVQWQQKN